MIYRIRNKIQKFWDMMTDNICINTIIGNPISYDSIGKDKIKKIFEQRIEEYSDKARKLKAKDELSIERWDFYNRIWEIQLLAVQLDIDLEEQDDIDTENKE